ncbi:MAG TPA: hypothetical protein VMS08_02910 [Candidatus Saccharimonadia bacterium]|nr:hypothetical protein [Candidatus Saccharimonadia bacterium]
MIKHLWSVLANEVSVDQRTNNLSIFGVLEELTIPVPEDIRLPTLVPLKHTIVSLWQKTRGEEVNFSLSVQIIAPNGDTLGEVIQPVKILPQHRRTRSIIQMDRFPLTGPGEYVFRVAAKLVDQEKETVYAQLPLDVIIPKTEN